ncbi:hypothetical protein ACLOJK_012606 [Asimina triloba]
MAILEPLVQILICIWSPICTRIGYVKNLKKNYEKLDMEVEKLRYRKEDVDRKIAEKRPTGECVGWLKEVDNIQNKWREIEKEYQERKTCLGGWCPNVSSLLNLGKRVVELISTIKDFKETSYLKGDIVINEPLNIMSMPALKVEANTTAYKILTVLLRMIMDESKNGIGLWGMGGIGKTTIMKVLHNQVEIAQLFEIILWVTVSKEGTNRTVLKELAKRLKVERQGGESNVVLKSKVFIDLRAKRFLLLLDDIWDMIDLEEAIVVKWYYQLAIAQFATRREQDGEIELKTLSKEESWLSFHKKVGVVADDRTIEAIARNVDEECCGLPLAIVVFAGVLRKEEDFRSNLGEAHDKGFLKVKELMMEELTIEIEIIGDLAYLKHVEVRCGPPCAFEEQEMEKFPRFSKLSALERLSIYVDGDDAEWWGKHSEGLISHLPNLEELIIRECRKMKEIINMNEDSGEKMVPVKSLPRLKTLILEDLLKLRNFYSCKKLCCVIWEAPKKALERVELIHAGIALFLVKHSSNMICRKVEEIISMNEEGGETIVPSFISHLPNLEELIVCECRKVEKIINMNEEGGEKMVSNKSLPRLKTLILEDLPKLKTSIVAKSFAVWSGQY